jgi:hypothetical protein
MVTKKSDPPNYTLAQAQKDVANLRGQISHLGATPTLYTPTVGGAGTITFTTQNGWYYRLGKLIFWNAYLNTNSPGTGASTVTISSPTSPDRSDRQVVSLSRSTSGGGSVAGVVIAFTGGSGAVWDSMTLGNGTTLVGTDFSTASLHVVQGWYREA